MNKATKAKEFLSIIENAPKLTYIFGKEGRSFAYGPGPTKELNPKDAVIKLTDLDANSYKYKHKGKVHAVMKENNKKSFPYFYYQMIPMGHFDTMKEEGINVIYVGGSGSRATYTSGSDMVFGIEHGDKKNLDKFIKYVETHLHLKVII